MQWSYHSLVLSQWDICFPYLFVLCRHYNVRGWEVHVDVPPSGPPWLPHAPPDDDAHGTWTQGTPGPSEAHRSQASLWTGSGSPLASLPSGRKEREKHITIRWRLEHLKSLATRLLVQLFLLANNKENINVLHPWLQWTVDSLTKGQ